MTTIELFTDDQKLYFTRKVYIASGDVESVQLHIDFCGAWDDFPVRTVTFTNDTTKISKDALMTYNRCIVPFEVLSKPGMLQVSVIANSTDGSKQKTSGMIKYRIDLGAELSDITLTPTMNVYQQFLSAIHDMEDPMTQAMQASVEATIATELAKLKAQVDEMKATVNGVVLWTNTNTSSSFAAQTVAVNLSGYNRFTILFKAWVDDQNNVYGSDHVEYHFTEKDIRQNANYVMGDSTCGRNFIANNSGIEFFNADNGNSGNSQEIKNKYLIPYKIKGYK